jgi:hypothetical protein
MLCNDCEYSANGVAGYECLLRKVWPGLAKSFAGGCNLKQANDDHKRQEAERVEKLPDLPIYPKGIIKAEKDLQSACEGMLRQWGYRPSTASEIIASGKDGAITNGWYIHLNKCEGNPLMSDLIIFDYPMRKCLAIELKVVSKYQPGQKEFIKACVWVECMSVEKFVNVVKQWEKSK